MRAAPSLRANLGYLVSRSRAAESNCRSNIRSQQLHVVYSSLLGLRAIGIKLITAKGQGAASAKVKP